MPTITFNAFDNRAQTPLVAIEREVQQRAKQADLDVNRPEGQARMAALIEEQVDRWRDEFRRGMRPHDLVDRDIVIDRALRNLLYYGPITPLLEDDNVWEVMI